MTHSSYRFGGAQLLVDRSHEAVNISVYGSHRTITSCICAYCSRYFHPSRKVSCHEFHVMQYISHLVFFGIPQVGRFELRILKLVITMRTLSVRLFTQFEAMFNYCASSSKMDSSAFPFSSPNLRYEFWTVFTFLLVSSWSLTMLRFVVSPQDCH